MTSPTHRSREGTAVCRIGLGAGPWRVSEFGHWGTKAPGERTDGERSKGETRKNRLINAPNENSEKIEKSGENSEN